MLIGVTFLLYAFFSILEAKSASISCPDGPETAKIMNGWRKGKRNLFFLTNNTRTISELYHDCNIISVESYYICTWKIIWKCLRKRQRSSALLQTTDVMKDLSGSYTRTE